MMRWIGWALAAGAVIGWQGVARGQALTPSTFTTTDLNPSFFAQGSAMLGVSLGQQVGFAQGPFSPQHAVFWLSSVQSLGDLNPPGFISSRALASNGGQQGGSGVPVGVLQTQRALIWSGTAASVVNLTPPGAQSAEVRGLSTGQQAGVAGLGLNGAEHAVLWAGSAASAVDLHPSQFLSSRANGISHDGSEQAGSGLLSSPQGFRHALIWHGTAASAVDITPPNFTSTEALATDGVTQVGFGSGSIPTGGASHALLWHGTAAGVVDLNPASFASSTALAVAGNQQVGSGTGIPTGGALHALLWTGTPASAVDLQRFLPVGFIASEATGIDVNGAIVGSGFLSNLPNGALQHAIEWVPVNGGTMTVGGALAGLGGVHAAGGFKVLIDGVPVGANGKWNTPAETAGAAGIPELSTLWAWMLGGALWALRRGTHARTV